MLEWGAPLWFLAAPLALLPWIAFWRPQAVRFSSLRSVRVRPTLRGALAWVIPALEMAVIAGLIAALAQPQRVQREVQRESQGLDIVLAIDTSGSMDTADMGTFGRPMTRLEAGRAVMQQFVQSRPDDRVGLVVFGEEAFYQVPLTLDHEGLAALIGQIEIGMAGKNATAVGSAIAVAAKRMKELTAPSRVLIVVTDGRSNAGPLTPRQAAEAAAALGIRVYPIGVGGGGGGVLNPFARAADINEPEMQAIAKATGGRYFRAADAASLAEVYATIDALEKSPAKVKEYVHTEELYLVVLAPTIAAWLAVALLSNTVLRQLP